MDSMMSIRNRILMNTPHLETASGNIANFKTDVPAKLKECKVYFEPKQEGSGTPSPTNVRNIVGYDSLTVNVNGTDVTVDFPTTVYGGYVDLVSGELVATHAMLQLNTADMNNDPRWPGWQNSGIRAIIGSGKNVMLETINNIGAVVSANTTGSSQASATSYDVTCFLITQNQLSQDEWKALALDVQIVIPYATPLRYSLTPQTIHTLKGVNNIFTVEDNTTLTATYWTH